MAGKAFYGWRLLGAFWVIAFINLAFPAYGASVLNAAMAQELHLNRQTLGTVMAIYLAMSGLPAPLVAWSVGRHGVRRTVLAGSALVAFGSALMALQVQSGLAAILCFGVLVGVGVCAGGLIASQVGIVRWFQRRRALALSLLYTGGAVGGYCSTWLLGRIAQAPSLGWRQGYLLMAGLSLLAAALAWLAVKESPADVGQHPDGIDPATASAAATRPLPAFVTREAWTPADAFRDTGFWIRVFGFCGVSLGFSLFAGQGIPHLRDLGHPLSVGAQAMGLIPVTGLLAKALLGAIGDRLDPRYLWGLFCVSFGIGLLLLPEARSVERVWAAAACMGIGFGGGLVTMMAVLSNCYGAAAFGAVSGRGIAINTALSAIAPIGAGYAFDQGFGYTPAFRLVALWCLVGGIAILLLRPPRLKRD